MTVDWGDLADQLGADSTVSTRHAHAVLAAIVGEDEIQGAVDAYLRHGRGSELARTVLRMLRTPMATEYCMTLYRAATTPERRRDVVELLRGICGPEGLAYFDELLADDSDDVAFWAADLLRELMWFGEDESDEFRRALAHAEAHHLERVRTVAAEVRMEIERLDGGGSVERP